VVWLWALVAPGWQVRRVAVLGTRDAALVAAIHRMPLAGCDAFRCDTARDARLVERLPAVAQADVWVAYPATLVVWVTPRVPVLLWRVAGQAYLVGADGTLIGRAPADAALPAVEDPQGAALAGAARPGARLSPALVQMAAQLLRALPGMLGVPVTLRYRAGVGLVADDGSGLVVAFGDPGLPPGDMPAGVAGQLAELRAILALLAQRGQQAEWIDLRWGWHPSYRLAGT
jgi:hypothetical protein